MKKLLSVFLALALMLSFVTPAFAYQGAKTADTAAQAEKAHDPATCTDCPVVIVRGMDMMGLYIDKGTENERNAFEFDLGDLLSMLYKGISGAVKAKDRLLENASSDLRPQASSLQPSVSRRRRYSGLAFLRRKRQL